jgi:S-formylglutathione hydrolase FrmB
MKLIWVAVGSDDFALAGTKAIDELLTKHGVKHEFTIDPGYRHEWRLWRQHLHVFAPLLFQDKARGTS